MSKKDKKEEVKKTFSNAEFAKSNKLFNDSITAAQAELGSHKCYGNQINPTTRQASKWRNKKGLVYKHSIGMI